MSPVMETLFGSTAAPRDTARERLMAAARERILVLDGAMGTQIQGLGFQEDHFRGDRFLSCACHQQGNNDLLDPHPAAAIEEIHFKYAIAGADIVETNTFSSTTIAQADYGMEDMVYELNRDGARLAKRRCAAPRKSTASRASSQARWARQIARPPSRPMSTIPATAPSPLMISASPMPSSCAA